MDETLAALRLRRRLGFVALLPLGFEETFEAHRSRSSRSRAAVTAAAATVATAATAATAAAPISATPGP